jgi:hypothetical protein
MSAADFLEFALAAALILLAFSWRRWIQPFSVKFAERTVWCMALLAALPIALRLLLLENHPVPSPDIYDEFGHLLVADTLRHFRFANPSHPLHQFFETFFVLQEPTYASIYPIGQGLMLAIGRAIFGHPWAGVVLSTGAFCGLCYWMLRAWTTPGWALAGGLLAVFEFGPLSQWMNSYWGGSFAACGGCLVFGALPRLRDARSATPAVALGLGLAINLLTRPYETIFLLVAVAIYLTMRRPTSRQLLIAAVALLPAIAVTLLQNKSVTGKWTTLPYQLSQVQYGVPASLTFQSDPVPHRDLTPQQQLEYKSQMAFRGSDRETLTTYLLRLEYRVRFYRFFFLSPLYLALPFFLWACWKERRFQWVGVTLLLFALGINFFPAFQSHYLAGVTCLLVLMSVIGLERLSALNQEAARVLVFLCVAYFGFWYTLHVFDNAEFSLAMRRYETWDGLNHRNPERRIFVNRQLDALPGKLLVFVHYTPQHIFQDEWVYNDADIDAARVVWARDLGESENAKLRAFYPDRVPILLEPDYRTPKLSPYQ